MAAKKKPGRPKKQPKTNPAELEQLMEAFRQRAPKASEEATNYLKKLDEERQHLPPNATLTPTEQLIMEEFNARRIEGWRLFTPINPGQREVFKSKASEIAIIGSNRSGKTTVATANFAKVVLGQHPRTIKGLHGGTSQRKYLGTPEFGGTAIVVGKDWPHIGRIIWKKLGRAGAFSIIRDLETGQWRAVKFSNRSDMSREDEWKLAPPLIPPRMIKDISWYNKRDRQPASIRLRNDWEIFFASSEGDIPQGDQYDLVWFDEEIVNEEWYPEVAVRGRVDRVGGFFQWSATPQTATEVLDEMRDRAANPSDDSCVEIFLHIDDNPSISKQAKEEFWKKLSPSEREVRYEGKSRRRALRVYPEFIPEIKCPSMPSVPGHIIDAFPIPSDWCRFLIVDPGVQRAAGLFAAIPPLEFGFEVHFYDEVYLERASADKFADLVKRKSENQTFQEFIIDMSMGRQTQIGSGISVEESYERAFRKKGLRAIATGYGFRPGSRDIKGREEAFRQWLEMRPQTDTPVLRVHKDKCKNFVWEMSKQVYQKRADGQPTDKRVDKDNHLVTCAEYFAARQPRYVRPRHRRDNLSDPILARLAKRAAKTRKKGGVDLSPNKRPDLR
jgi:hypothetical protein